MAVSDAPWDGAASKYSSTNAYCDACLIDENASGQDKVQAQCHLPVKEPSGAINRSAVHSAAAALAGGRGGVKASADSKKKAARKLLSMYAELKEDPPDSITQLARS